MKDKLNITLDIEVKENFTKLCKIKALNRSQWIENMLRKFVEENKELLKDRT